MEVIFLGTGTSQGVPVISCDCPVCISNNEKDKRLRCSILIKGYFGNILIDTSIDLRIQLLREKITHLDGIFYTHEHIDHTGGLDDLRPLIYNKNNINEQNIYASKNVIEHIMKAFYYIFEQPDYPGIPKLKLNLINSEDFFYFNKEKIIIIEGLHGKIPVFGYRIRNFVYLTDFSFIPFKEYEKLKNIEVLVINCLRKEPKHHSHFILKEVLEQIKIIKPKKTYLTHISHDFGLYEDIKKQLPKNIYLTYDGLKIDID